MSIIQDAIQLGFDSPKLCECGCGQPAPLAKATRRKSGYIKGQPVRFIRGHMTHLMQSKRHPGYIYDPTKPPKKKATTSRSNLPPKERFWSRIDKSPRPKGCWLWTGTTNPDGYGNLFYMGKSARAHRIAYTLTNGPIPKGLQVCHQCDNPPCCNPAHLFLGTNKDNHADKEAKGRGHQVKGEKHPHSKLTEDVVTNIRILYANGHTSSELANQFGTTRGTVWRVVRGYAWKHVA